jgi:hypothetical protein
MNTLPDKLPESLRGQLDPVAIVAKRRTGRKPSKPTIWRWCKRGCRGVRLEAANHSGQWYTTAEAFDQFLAGQTAAALAAPDPERQATDRAAEDDELREAGLL